MRIQPISFGKDKNYYGYGNQKFIKKPKKSDKAKNYTLLALGVSLLGVGVLTKTRRM